MKEFIKKYWITFLVIFTVLGLSYNIYNDKRRDKLLKKSNYAKGILIEEKHESASFRHGKFYFYVKGMKIIIKDFSYYNHLKIGDTVLIEYAIEDPTVAIVKDKYYMKKFNYMKKKHTTNPH